MVPLRTEMNIQYRVTVRNLCPIGLIEGQPGGMPVATSLNQPEKNGQLVARYFNFTEQPMRLSAGSTIVMFTGVEEDPVKAHLLGPNNIEDKADHTSTGSEKVTGTCRKYFMLLKAVAWDRQNPGS